jgi:alginate O-acetyltransferase complex protein AlgI
MLFNSYVFIFGFLPIALGGFYLFSRMGSRAAAGWLVFISVVFYGWWNPPFVMLLAASVGLNYGAAMLIGATESRPRLQSACLAAAVAANLSALVYYKYLASIIHAAIGLGLLHGTVPDVVLPLGISFFTFTQIGYLVDRKQGVAKDHGPLSYVLFVTFFPHLIAGPILHNREIMPQFADPATYRVSAENVAVGLSIFVLGLAKKCLLADPLSGTVTAGFADARHATLLGAWDAALCFSLQIYFDFSGYSDMAIGLARMFNVKFPLNFNSPYKAASIIDLWQRWHITLSRYLAMYLYNPIALAVSRWRADHGLGIARDAQRTLGGFTAMVMFPTVVTMALAGIWHGAGVQFLIFGLLHGSYLTINHAYRVVRGQSQRAKSESLPLHCAMILLTYLAALVAFVFFRAQSVGSAVAMLGGMVGLHGIASIGMPSELLAHLGGLGNRLAADGMTVPISPIDFFAHVSHIAWMICLYIVVWGCPNTQQIMRRFAPALGRIQAGPFQAVAWRPSRGWAVALGVVACFALLAIGGTSEFLYFQF